LATEINFPGPVFKEALFQDVADDGLPVRYRAIHGGRGSGKSHSFARALILKARGRPLRVGCYREIQKSIRDSVKRLLDDQIVAAGLSSFFTSTDTEIRGANGSLFIFNGLRTNPDAVKSTEGLDIAAVFEANKVSRRSWELLTPTVRSAGSEIWAEWNPEFETDPVDEMFRGKDGPPPGSIVRQVNFDGNRFFPDVLKQELEWDRKRDPEKYAHIWLGGYQRNSEARVFKNWTVEEFDRPPGTIHRFGADWGFSIDPSVMVRCSIDGNRLYVDYEAWQLGCEIVNLPDLFMAIPEAEKWPSVADSSRPETISHLRKNGFPKMQAAIKGTKSLEEGVAFLQSFDIVVHSRCQHVIDELTLYRYKTDPLTNKVLPLLEDKNNHCIDALRYACEGARRAGKQPPKPKAPAPRVNLGPQGWMN
jgi:phage terminase large subunit